MRFGHQLSALSFVCLVAGSLTPSCVENRSSFFVIGATAGDQGEGGCEVEAAVSLERPTSRGYFDLVFSDLYGYRVPIVLGNQLQPLGDDDTLRTETSRIQIEGAEISAAAISGGSISPSAYTVAISGLVDTSDGEEPGIGWVSLELAPLGAITEPGEYEFTVIFFGRTLGGTPMETGEWTFTLEAGFGGLADCTTADEEEIVVNCAPGSNLLTDFRYAGVAGYDYCGIPLPMP